MAFRCGLFQGENEMVKVFVRVYTLTEIFVTLLSGLLFPAFSCVSLRDLF